MVEAEEKREANHISVQMNDYPRDLLQRSISGSHFPRKFEEVAEEEEEEEEIELSLGLSLNGRFGVDPKRAKRLTRSSSISDFMMTNDHKVPAFMAPPVAYTPLIRTCSLPTENTEEWRKRKELQSLRRMEAKRKRSEKLKNGRTVRDPVSVEENAQAQGQGSVSVNGQSEFSPSGGVPAWVSGAARRAGTGSARGSESKGERGIGVEGLPPAPPSSQGSIGSQASASSGISEFESQPTQGINICSEARSPASVLSLPKQNDRKPVVTPGTTTGKSIQVTGNGNEAKEIMKNMTMIDMPCVTTRVAGPNGKRVEGFLYRYGKGEEVRIVCVCHGSFLSPAEFVKHGGGGDVAHPLRHIVVNPSPLL